MKKLILFGFLVLIMVFNVVGLTIEEQMEECEGEYKDLCLATLSSSIKVDVEDERPLDELVAKCESNGGDLCISTIAKSRDDKTVCKFIEEAFIRESCVRNIDFSRNLENIPEESGFNLDLNLKRIGFYLGIGISIIVGVFILIFIYLSFKNKPGKKVKDLEVYDDEILGYLSEAIKFVKKARESGMGEEKIRENLMSSGWPMEMVDKAFGEA
tara:strand:+ start:9478 stop:10116 length:639 start_codon:yes stop_codon:yes gene_type:complete